jgi:hypothetical protein
MVGYNQNITSHVMSITCVFLNTTYVMLVQAIEKRFAFETRQGNKFDTVIQTGEHRADHSLNVEKWKHADVNFLKRV